MLDITFNPSTLLLPEAHLIRPRIDAAIRSLRMVAMFLDSLIESDMPRRATAFQRGEHQEG